MTLRRARTWVCDDCENGTEARDPSGVVCCEHCDEPPCQFVATFEQCSFFTTVTGSYTKEHIKPAGYLYLLKECLRGCKWQAKWSALGDTGGCPAPPESYGIASCWRPLLEEASELGCCWWGGGSGADGNSPCNPDIDEFLWLMWELEITSPTTATLTVTPKTGGSAQYTCDDFDCMADGNQFKFDRDGATDNLKFLPCGVCVRPVNTADEMELKCDTAEHQCECCDPGVDGLFQVQVTGCDFLTETNVVDAIRHCDPTPLGTGISYPGDQHGCCVFVADLGTDTGCTVDSVGYTGAIRLIIYCSAADTYKIKVYCQKTDLSFTLAGNAAVTLYECRCNGWYIEFTLPDPLPCCCPSGLGSDCCPCTDGDERIVEVTFAPTSGTACVLTGQFSQNSAATGCTFLLDGMADADCQVLGGGSITCDGTTWDLQATTGDGIDPGTETEWGPGMSITVNNCDPLDVDFIGPQGTVTIVEVP